MSAAGALHETSMGAFTAHEWIRSAESQSDAASHHCVQCVLQVVDPVAAAQPAARSKDLMRAMKEAAQGMRGGREVRTRAAHKLA